MGGSSDMTADAPPRVGNPYVGPTSFRLGDPLYGRDEEQEDLLDLLVAERIVLLYSPSGAGKTSLIQAALVPALRAAGFEVLPVIRVTHALEPRPGMPSPRNRYVLGALLSLEEGVAAEKQRPVAELATSTLRDYLRTRADRDGRSGNDVLVFDQFEEVLTADPTDAAAKHEFFRDLGEALRDRGHWALFSMREDFLAALDPYLRHVPTRLRSTYRLDLLSVPEALEAMRRPAQRAGVDFAEEAAIRLVDDLRRVRVQTPGGGTEDALGSYVEPVQLQVSCRLLWSMLPPGTTRITPAEVGALGDVDQALADYYADRVRTAAERSGVREAAIRDWFEQRLITPQGLRGQVLEGPEVAGDAGPALLRELVDAHLIRAESRRQATWYELAHDRLVEPVRRDNAAFRAQYLTEFERAAMLWEAEGKPDRLLLLGPDLASAEHDPAVRAGGLPARQQEFLESSRRAQQQVDKDRRTAIRTRRLTVASAVAGFICLVLAITAAVFLVRSRDSESQAQDEEAQKVLLYEAQRDLDWEQDRAVALAAAGARHYLPDGLNSQTRDLLYEAAIQSPVSLVLRGQQGPTTSAAWPADGSAVVVAGAEDIQIWDRETGEPQDRLPLQEDEVVTGLDVNQDGSTVVAGMENGILLVWDRGSPPVRWDEGTGLVWTVDLSPDGQRIASVGAGNRVQVWALDGEQLLTLTDAVAREVNSLAFSPDGSRLATVSDAPEVVLWDAVSGSETGRLPLPESAWSVVFGQDAGSLATITSTDVTVWDLSTGSPRHPPFEESSQNFRNVDNTLSRVLTVDPSGTVTTYDLVTGGQVGSSSVPGASVWGAGFDVDPGRVLVLGDEVDPAFWDLTPNTSFENGFILAATPASDRILSAWSDGALRVWDGEDGERSLGRTVPGVDASDTYSLTADANGERVAAVTGTGSVRSWDVTTGTELPPLEPDTYSYWSVALTHDGTRLITGDSGGRIVTWDAATGTELAELTTVQDQGISLLEVSPDSSMVAAVPFADARTAADDADESGPVAFLTPLSGEEPVELTLPATGGPVNPIVGATPAESVTAVAFSPDGETVTLGTSAGGVAAFDVRTGTALWDQRDVHTGSVNALTVADAPGEVLTTGSNRVVLLDGERGRHIREIPYEFLSAALHTADGEHIVLYADEGARVLPLRDEVLVGLVGSKTLTDLEPSECEAYRLSAGC